MSKKIFQTVLFLAAVVVILTTTMLASIFYDFFSGETNSALRADAMLVAQLTSQSRDNVEFLQSLSQAQTDYQITLMDEHWQTLFDSYHLIWPAEHNAQLPEIQGAYLSGLGTDKRLTNVPYYETSYCAILLDNGNILRVAKTAYSKWGIYLLFLSPLCLLELFFVVLCLFLSKRLTGRIAASINSIDLEGYIIEPFDELSPLLSKISRQKAQIDEQLRTMEGRAKTNRAITEDMREGLLLLDAEGMILSANVSALRLLGDPVKEYTGRHILQLTRDMTIINKIKEAFAGQSGNTVLTIGHKTVQVFINPVFEEDSVDGAIILFLDITEKANAEQIRREFSANVSHELKTPLTSILGYSEIISSGMGKGDDIAVFAGKINTEIKRLITLINDIIKLSELDESTGEMQLESFDLLRLANSTADDLAHLAGEKEVTVEVTGEPMEIKANQSMVGELMFNLLDNGIKNNRSGGKVILSLRRNGEETVIQVRDNGIGIASEHLDRVFERFYQVDKSRSQKSGGTGLGLSIVKHIAQYHNGYATIESKEGEGTTVTAVLHNGNG